MSHCSGFRALAKNWGPQEWRDGIDTVLKVVKLNPQQQAEWLKVHASVCFSVVDLKCQVKDSMPCDLEGLDTSKPSWLPNTVMWLGPQDFKLDDLIPPMRRSELEQEQADGDFEESERREEMREEMEQAQQQAFRQEQERRQSSEFTEQVHHGTARQAANEDRERAEADIQCITCGGLEGTIIICAGGVPDSEYHTAMHSHPKLGWHLDCIPLEALEVPKAEVAESPDELVWCCKACADSLAAREIWLAWKIKAQKVVSSRQVYTVQWLGSQPDSDQHYADLKGTTVHKLWIANR